MNPRNPNICLGCEQLLEHDCAELEELLGNVELLPEGSSTRSEQQEQTKPSDSKFIFEQT